MRRPMSAARPLSAFWFLYMAGLGLVFPYQTLYFHENAALTGAQLGLLLAVRPAMGIVFQPFWGHVADRSGSRTWVLAGVSVATAAAYAILPLAERYPALLLAMAFASAFGTSVMPMATSVTMASLPEGAEHFGRVRVWGTIGFLLLVVGFPWVLDGIQELRGLSAEPGGQQGGPSEPGLGVIFVLAAGFSALAAIAAVLVPREGAVGLRATRGDLGALLRHRPYRRLLVFTFVAYFFLQGPILLFPVFIRAHGGTLDTLSRMWIPMLLLEIPLVFYSGATLRRFGARGLLAIGVTADGLRWLVCSFASELWVIYAFQLLHGVVIAGLIVGVSLYVEVVVPERLRSTGQGLVAMIGISLASMLSSTHCGWLLDRFGANAPYLVGGTGAVLLAATIPWLLPRPTRPA